MAELTVSDLLAQARNPALSEPESAVAESSLKEESAPDDPGAMPAGPRRLLEIRAAQFPQDKERWETLLHNVWQVDEELYWAFLVLRLGGCQLVPHKDAGLAVRFDPERVAVLRRRGDGMLLAGEAAYGELRARFLLPRRDEVMQQLQWASLGRAVDEDLSGWVKEQLEGRKMG